MMPQWAFSAPLPATCTGPSDAYLRDNGDDGWTHSAFFKTAKYEMLACACRIDSAFDLAPSSKVDLDQVFVRPHLSR